MKLIIMRGLPGSGKSTLAAKLAKKHNAIICSADDFFVSDKGEYLWDQSRLHMAHQSCYNNAQRALREGRNVIIDNTNIARRWYTPYLLLAEVYGAEATIAEVVADVKTCFKRGKHGVPLANIEKMASKWHNETEVEKEDVSGL